MFSILLDINTEKELLGCMIILCLTSWGTGKLFSKAAAQFHIPIAVLWGFQCLYILTNTYYCPSFWLKWVGSKCHIVVLICISILTNDVEQLFMFVLLICRSSLQKCLFISFDQFEFGSLHFYCLCIPDTTPLPDMWFANIFYHSLGCSFHFLDSVIWSTKVFHLFFFF